MNVQFLRVLGIRSHTPAVVALVDGLLVKWNPGPGWVTDCDCPPAEDCQHIDAVLDHIDPRVMGGQQ
jgi:hypothetical protein